MPLDVVEQREQGAASGGGAAPARADKHWIGRIAARFEENRELLRGPHAPQLDARIVLFSVVPWHHGSIEHLIATSLRLKGAFVRSIICSGQFPVCSMEIARVSRPRCGDCLARAQRYMDAFRLDHLTTGDFVTQEDFDRAEQRVASWDDSELVEATYEGVPIGRNAFRDINQYLHYPVLRLGREEIPIMRKFLTSNIVNVELAERVRQRLDPTHVIVSNGKAVAYASIYSTMVSRGVETITWDQSPAFRDGFTFNRNCYATEIHLEREWETHAQVPLTAGQKQSVEDYFSAWQAGRNARYQYQHGSISDAEDLQQIVRAADGRRIITIFSNLTWETSHLDRNVGFDHLLDAVFWLMDYVGRSERYHLVVRAHPAEVKVPHALRTVVPLPLSLRQRHRQLPPNVTVLPGESPVNSYQLADMSDVVCVYTSTLGFEMAVAGRACLVLGDCHYRGKGFTEDIDSAARLAAYLDDLNGRPQLSAAQQALAKRYAYLWLFRHVVRMPYLDERSRTRYHIDEIRDLLPGSGSVIDRLTDAILSGGPFLDISQGEEASGAMRS